jgi:nitroimidazol reductase NimA-like FMN-containing flavoprotein (pyridoxamine 5'-phosphate oxidase superfamily)
MFDTELIKQRLHDLLTSQKLAVLSTTNKGQSYASLVAFVATEDMKELLFATARTTRKFANLADNSHVAMLIDSRSNQEADFHEAIAATATGTAEEITDPEQEALLALYLDKHPHLVDFVNAPSCALIRVRVTCYYLVSRFQNVVEVHVT